MKMKTLVVVLFVVIFTTTVLSSSLMSSKAYYQDKTALETVDVQQTNTESTNTKKLTAMLKGSIYETGEQMTVFGACFDGYGYLIADPTLNATLSSWYANGTQWELDMQMTPVLVSNATTGRWEYQVAMPAVSGTYLTEITCRYQGDIALAFGEWQNPDWVARINQIQQNQTYMQVYLETTLFPMVNASYQATLQMLASIGVIETNVNATLSIVNSTQQQVINISTGVDELLNKSRRIRAWITV